MPRPSQLDPYVRLSPHTAPDILSFRICSCECNRDKTHVSRQDFLASNYHDSRLHGGDGFFRLL